MFQRLLADAGVEPGMRVLDVGCGGGDVSLLVARRVGASGTVVGIDRSARAIAMARRRVTELGQPNLRFEEADLLALDPALGLFDAVVGRRVLMYVPEPALALRRLSEHLHPGGIMAFSEVDATMPPTSTVPLPLHERVRGWLWATAVESGADPHLGLRLFAVLEAAGLAAPSVRAEAIVHTPDDRPPTAEIVAAMLPRMLELGIVDEAEVELGTLDQRLGDELARARASYVGELSILAWARRPA
ncbi:MAG: methyltransferase domain-containing protein [Myxococcales bacterium]|nr:methyltransferase domain-containing protein [Myxococcales bacterium]MCB9714117.1 methyltransferase domain-containing protein [Myxococcales bacterium]